MKIFENEQMKVNFPKKCASKGEIEIELKEDNFKNFNTAFMGASNLSISLIKLEKFHGVNLIYKNNKLEIIPRKTEDNINLEIERKQKDDSWFKKVRRKLKINSLEKLINYLKEKKEKKDSKPKEKQTQSNKGIEKMVERFLNKLP